MRPTSFNSERGAILPIVIILMLALTITGLAFLGAGVMENKLAMREVHKNQAFWLAEGGLEHLLVKLKAGEETGDWDLLGTNHWLAIGETALGDGGYRVEYYEASSPYAISTGRIEKGGQEILKSIKMTIRVTSFFEFALFGDEGILMDSNAGVVAGPVGTNSSSTDPPAIVLRSNAAVDPNQKILVPEGNPDIVLDEAGTVQPDQVADLGDPREFPVEAPTGLLPCGSLHLGTDQTAMISSSGSYSSIILDSNSTLTIDPTIFSQEIILYVEDQLEINSNAQIILAGSLGDPGVQIYFGGDLVADSNGFLNVSQVPSRLKIFGVHPPVIPPELPHTVTLNSNVVFHGGLCAPNAVITINSNADVNGSITGQEIVMDSNANILFDQELADSGPFFTGLKDWEELPYTYKASSV